LPSDIVYLIKDRPAIEMIQTDSEIIARCQRWKERVKEERLPWPQLTTKAAGVYGINSWPETVVIDKNGSIVSNPQTIEELSELLQMLQ